MKTRCIGIILALGLCTNAFALTRLGPPTTDMRAGQWAIGVDAAWSEQDLELEIENLGTATLKDVEVDTVLANIAVGLATDRAELFGRIGTATAKWSGQTEFGEIKAESDDELAVGGGVRITTNLDDPLSWGLVAQMLYWQIEDEADCIEAQIGLGPCLRSGGFVLYGGPMIHVLDAEWDEPPFGSAELEQDSYLGGWLGAGVEIAEHWMLTGELQATPDAFGWALAAQVRF